MSLLLLPSDLLAHEILPFLDIWDLYHFWGVSIHARRISFSPTLCSTLYERDFGGSIPKCVSQLTVGGTRCCEATDNDQDEVIHEYKGLDRLDRIDLPLQFCPHRAILGAVSRTLRLSGRQKMAMAAEEDRVGLLRRCLSFEIRNCCSKPEAISTMLTVLTQPHESRSFSLMHIAAEHNSSYVVHYAAQAIIIMQSDTTQMSNTRWIEILNHSIDLDYTFERSQHIEASLEILLGCRSQDQHSVTPLHTAAFHGCPKVIEVLLQYDADTCAREGRYGQTALIIAASKSSSNHIQVVQLLLARGMDPTTPDWDGWTAFHVAQYKNNTLALEAMHEWMESRL